MPEVNHQTYLETLGKQAKEASYQLAALSADKKNQLLQQIAILLKQNQAEILQANQQDVQQATAAGLNQAMIDRLLLDESRLAGVIADIDNVINLADPVGNDIDSKLLPSGLRLTRRRVPLGVIGVIYEARPNVTIDIAVLGLKTGNAVILRGGKETINTNKVLANTIEQALVQQGLSPNTVQLIKETDRALVTGLLKLDQYVDMIVPRGGQKLQRLCAEQASIPVILGGIGICHMYIDKHADLSRINPVIINAKVQRPTVCNALDTLLVHQDVATAVIANLCQELSQLGVAFYVCDKTMPLVQTLAMQVHSANEETYSTEWLSLNLGIRIVEDMTQAIEHIRQHTTGHSEAILTENIHTAERFIKEVDAAAVYVNASTRFTDGAQFGLGAEVAVSTQKLHARGPMGLEALTTFKWLAWGDYTSRQ